jgi:hypothetical protein
LFPLGCRDNKCTFINKWKNDGVSMTDFFIAAQIGDVRSNWLAIGFSEDDQMVN